MGNDQNPGEVIAELGGAEITVAFVRMDDTDGATLDFSGGGSVTATAPAEAQGIDLFVAESGSDGGNDCANQASPCATVDRCIERGNTIGSGARCLLNRGDTFDESGAGDPRSVTGPLWFGAFGNGDTPVVLVDDGDRFTAVAEVRIFELSVVAGP